MSYSNHTPPTPNPTPTTPQTEHSLETVLRTLASYSAPYKHTHFGSRLTDVGLTPDELPAASPTDALRFFYHHFAFNRAGGLRAGYNTLAVNAVDALDNLTADALWTEFKTRCNARDIGLNKPMTRGVLTDTLELTQTHGNLFAWVADTVQDTGSVKPAYNSIGDLYGVGDKICRFFIRDAVWITDVESAVPPSERHLLQPMDVWTRRTAKVIWSDSWGASDAELSRCIAESCNEYGVSNAEFNQGAWFYGAKEQDGDTQAFVSGLSRLLNGVEPPSL